MSLHKLSFACALFVFLFSSNFSNAGDVSWPEGKKIAISLSYDDALGSQLDNVVPALNQRGFKASFYVFPASDAFRNRFDEWKALSAQGHELGNHSLHHGCSRSLAGDWVPEHLDLDKRTVEDLVMEVQIANTMLQAIDGSTRRTFTVPCGNLNVKDGNYVEKVADKFVALKGQEVQSGFATFMAPAGHSAEELIEFVKNTPSKAKLVNILFHGVGGEDHPLRVTPEAHNALLDFLAKNQDKYWVDSYINIMTHVLDERAK